ncbi:ribonuclease-3 [Tetraselmis virus 1]|uniref:ribonuclease III n=1 Tax=Tetraselmis virus 1 TaxID=2060617 RepID=A0A2P0VNZ5_9VIRU|nr:ribonuclease-3 [Tetraselmis virus 1]AUF82636.1 ribonuclease-3 [Tetraselmis virus 1]
MNTDQILSSINIVPKNGTQIYDTALRHRSTGHKYSNERLEFLGDTVLATAISQYLIERYPTCDEGFLTKMRTKLVRGTTLSYLAKKIHLGDAIQVSEHAAASGIHFKENVLEDTLEAIIGAMFLDRGFEYASKWIRNIYEQYFDFSGAIQQEVTEKERLIKISKNKGDELSFNTSRTITGFKVCIKKVSSNSPEGLVIGVGDGNNKKDALDKACKRGLQFYIGNAN